MAETIANNNENMNGALYEEMLIRNDKGQVGFVLDETLTKESGEGAILGATVDCIKKNLKNDYPRQLILGRAVRRAGEAVSAMLKTEGMLQWFKDHHKKEWETLKEFVEGNGRFAFYCPAQKSNYVYDHVEGWAKLAAEAQNAKRIFDALNHELLAKQKTARVNGTAEEVVAFKDLERNIKCVGFAGENRKGWEREETIAA